MNPTATIQETWPVRVHTKIVGTTFDGRQTLLAECAKHGVSELTLVGDPDNPYDEHAVALEAEIPGEGRVRLGFLSNSDRICSDCGTAVGGSLFTRSKRWRCGTCGCIFGYDRPTVAASPDGTTTIECPNCSSTVDFDGARIAICPHCGGIEFGRNGIATGFSRAIAAGVQYRVKVMEFTGGDVGPDGRTRSMGCNVLIERIDERR